MSTNNKWGALSMRDRAFLIRESVKNGITSLDDIRNTWEHRFDGLRDVVEKVNTSDKDFVKRLRQEGRGSIPDWEDPNGRRIATHKLSVATDENGIHYIYPDVQNINGQLIDFTNPKIKGHGYGDGIAAERGDTIQIGNTNRDLRNAIKFTEKYKKLGIYPEFSAPTHKFDGNSNQPTEDEYIAQRAKEKIVEALAHARNRKETIQPYIEKSQKYKEYELEQLQMLESDLADLYIKANSKFELSYDELGVPKLTKVIDPALQKSIHNLQDFINKYKIKCSKSHTHGPGCLATVMDDYGKTETWNKRFAQDPRKSGFVEIDQKDILPGDIVQFGDYYRDTETGAKTEWEPVHAMMANTPYHEIPKAVKYNGSNGSYDVRINSSYPVNSWKDNTKAFRFVGDKADSLQWKKEYREKYEHQFSGEKRPYKTDSKNERDSTFMERLAYNIASTPRAKDSGRGGLGSVLEGIFNTVINRSPYEYDELKAFLGNPEQYGYVETKDNRGPQFNNIISRYEDKNIKTYNGVINPYNEYVVTQQDYDKFMDMAAKGTIFYSNADGEYFDYYYQGDPDNSSDRSQYNSLETAPRSDVFHYPIEFVLKDGDLFANAADFYDFSTGQKAGPIKKLQSRLLTKQGKPYIIRQNMIPVRAIDLPEEFLSVPTRDYKGNESNMNLTEEQKRARNMHRNVELFESITDNPFR